MMVHSGPVSSSFRRSAAALMAVIVTTAFSSLSAQQRVDPEAIGMAKASVATARGLSALGSNLGGLGLDRLGARDSVQHVELELSAIPFGAAAGSTYLSADDLDFVFASKNREDFDDSDRLRLAKLLEEGRLSADAAVDLFALRLRVPSVGAFAVRYGHRVRAQMTFPENFRTTVLSGGDVYKGGERFGDPEIGGEWTRSVSAAFATDFQRPYGTTEDQVWFPSFGVGISLGYVQGMAHFDVDPESWARTRAIPSAAGESYRRIEVEGGYSFRTSTPFDSGFSPSSAILSPGFIDSKSAAGDGWEGGVGMAVVILRTTPRARIQVDGDPLNPEVRRLADEASRDAVVFGWQLDGFGAIRWNGKNLRRSYSSIRDTLSEKDGPISNDVIYRYEAPLDTIGPFTTQLPALARFGVGADLTSFVPSIPGDLLLSSELAFDLNRTIGGEKRTRFSLGASWSPTRYVTVRTGLQLGGRVGAAMALGGSFRPVEWLALDIGTAEVNGLLDGDRRRLDVAFRGIASWRF